MASVTTALLFMACTAQVVASGHGPVFGGATPTLGKGGWQFDQAWMGRTASDATEQTLRSMISFGITPRVQVSASVPVPLTTSGQLPTGRMTATMSDAPNFEGRADGAFTRALLATAHGSNRRSMSGVRTDRKRARGIKSSPATNVAARDGLRIPGSLLLDQRRIREAFGAATATNGATSAITASSTAIDRRPCNSIIRNRICGSSWRRKESPTAAARAGACANPDTGGNILLVGPTTLLLCKQYGLAGGVLFPSISR